MWLGSRSMSVSVLIPAYGGGEWDQLAWSRAFPSARSQCEDVNVFYDPEGTIASVRNELAASAKGEWLCFLDADDELAPGYLDAMGEALEQVDGGDYLLTPSRNHKGVFAAEKSIFESNWLCIGTLVPRDLFLKVGGFVDYPYGYEDWALWVKCVQAGAQIVKVPDALYRSHRSQNPARIQYKNDRAWQSETHALVAAELGL